MKKKKIKLKLKKYQKKKFDKFFKLNIQYSFNNKLQCDLEKINYDNIIYFLSNEWIRIIKNFELLFDVIQISTNSNYFSFNSSNEDYNGYNIFKFNNSTIKIKNLKKKSNQLNRLNQLNQLNQLNSTGIYLLEDLVAFTKLNGLGNDSIVILMGNNNFINMQTNIDNCAEIKITFVPVKSDTIESIQNNNSMINSNEIDFIDNLSENYSSDIIYVEIIQVEFFKQLFESLEKHFPEILIKFSSSNNIFSIEINSMSNAGGLYINSTYSGSNVFGKFKILSKPIGINVCLKNLNNVLKTVESDDILILSVEKNYRQHLIIQLENPNKNYVNRKYKINLTNPTINHQDFKKIYSKKISFGSNSNEFFKICKDIGTIGEIIQLQYLKKNIIFSCMEFNKYTNYLKKNSELIQIESYNDNHNLMGAFEVKDIIIFNKIDDYIEIFDIMMKDDGSITLNMELKETIGNIQIHLISKSNNLIKLNDEKMINSNIENVDDKILSIKLKKIRQFKTIIDTFDKIITDISFVFNSYVEEDKFSGLELSCVDDSRTLFVKTKLKKELFKTFYCNKNIVKFDINLDLLNKILRLTDSDDIAIYFYIEKNESNWLSIRFKNIKKKNIKIFKIPLITHHTHSDAELCLNFDKRIIMNTEYFFSNCKSISNTCEYIKITCDDSLIKLNPIINGKNISDSLGEIKINNDEYTIVNLEENKINTGIYELKNIIMFSKLVGLSDNYSICMKNNFPLTLFFSFEEIGTLVALFSPTSEDYINNVDYDYSDDSDDSDVELLEDNDNISNF